MIMVRATVRRRQAAAPSGQSGRNGPARARRKANGTAEARKGAAPSDNGGRAGPGASLRACAPGGAANC